MKKIGVLLLAFLFVFILALTIVSAQNATEDKAYACLENKVKDKCKNLGLEEQAFSLLALSHKSSLQSECKSALKNKGQNNECWPSGGCKIKDTALSLLALANIGENTEKAEDWLLSHNKTPSELEWYLEIDASQATQCTITYDSTPKIININENKKISEFSDNCLSRAYDNYWLKISCLNKKFVVSCDKDFISTILYKKTGSNVWFVSSQVESASAGGKTENQINSYCFGLTNCDYEGSLWAVLALQEEDRDVSSFLPYIMALSEDNKKYFPSSFLYIAKTSDEYLQEILSLQNSKGYWDIQDEYYDTALALLALPESQAETTAKTWLGEVQGTDGCWNNNLKDTAFLLWAAFPKTPVATGGTTTPECEPTYYCTTKGECEVAEGNVLNNYYCSGLRVCCDKPAKQETCKEKGGEVCEEGEKCSEATILTLDEDECCLETCEEEKTECEQYTYNCRNDCLKGEEETTFDCNTGEVCCKEKGKKGVSWLIWLLAILIILVILGIIFRNKLRIFLFKLRGGFKKGGVTKTYPPYPPAAGLRRMFPTRMMPARPLPSRQATAKPQSKTDKELEETLKKLKEMSE